jgi:hypothetical protein
MKQNLQDKNKGERTLFFSKKVGLATNRSICSFQMLSGAREMPKENKFSPRTCQLRELTGI